MTVCLPYMTTPPSPLSRQNKREDSEFKEELRALFSTMCTLMGYQENKIRNVHVIQVRPLHLSHDVSCDPVLLCTECSAH